MAEERENAQPPAAASRRTFLGALTVGIGGVIGVVMAIPLVRYLFYPVGRKIVSNAGGPIDVLGLDQLEEGGAPVRVELVGDNVRDAWASADRTKLGAAWLQRKAGGEVVAFSSVCPHLGCSINYDGSDFRCPCHKSAFGRDGAKQSGPSKRGLDPLPVDVKDGRVLVTYRAFKPDISERVEASADEVEVHEHPA